MNKRYSAQNDKKILHGLSNHIVSISLYNLLNDMDINSNIEDIWAELLSMNDRFGDKILPVKELKKELNNCVSYNKPTKCWIFNSNKEYKKFIKDMSFMVSMRIVHHIESSGIGRLVINSDNKVILSPTIRAGKDAYKNYLKVIGV